MDELELLKKDWKKQGDSFQKLSYNEIYKMIHKKSSSVVKWIFIICIAEFLFWGFANLLIPDSFFEIYEKLHIKSALTITTGVHYIVVIGFIYLFYKNYNAICVIDNTSLLMKKIIKTRKTVNYYVYYNIIVTVLLSIVVNVIMFSDEALLNEVLNPENKVINFNALLIVQIISLIIMIGLLWLYYRLIYGILLRKLNKNYKELESLEV